ncbi:MAG: DUF350 domain-containing protein [Candidatus Micrarchaeia archaeon]
MSIISAIIQLILGILFSCFSVYLGLRFFDKLTVGIDEMKELKKGNVAIAILFLFVIISIGMIIKSSVENILIFFLEVNSLPLLIISFVMAIIQIIITMLLISIVMYVGIKVYDSLTPEVSEFNELKKGNVAIAIILGGVIFVISLITSIAISNFVKIEILQPKFISKLIGIP